MDCDRDPPAHLNSAKERLADVPPLLPHSAATALPCVAIE